VREYSAAMRVEKKERWFVLEQIIDFVLKNFHVVHLFHTQKLEWVEKQLENHMSKEA